MYEITWQDVIPHFAQFERDINQYSSLTAKPAYSIQPRLYESTSYLLKSDASLLLVTAPDTGCYFDALKELVIQIVPTLNNNLILADHFDEDELFGAAFPDEQNQKAILVPGLLHKANNGVIILSLTHLLAKPRLWFRLKSLLSAKELNWRAKKKSVYFPIEQPAYLDLKVILVGDRALMAEFEEREPELHRLGLYSEYEQDFALTGKSIAAYLSFIKAEQAKLSTKPLSVLAVKRLLQAGARYTEDQYHMPLCLLWLQQLLKEALTLSAFAEVTSEDISQAIANKYFRESYLARRSLDDIHRGHVFIDTSGEHIGQVNGLTVIEIPGHPLTYGEPSRISCVIHLGDGDISDVERKAEMAGSIHAKGMMIMQAFVNTALDLEQPLPYSASIVFEQSYCEVDGDSASLAELCAFISALAHHPIKQSIAITGAVDQFGRVQAVGGINEKIEGFYSICSHRGLTGSQGVILPKANLSSLCLSEEVAKAVKEQQFHLWAVEHVEDVFPLITGLPLKAEKTEIEEQEKQEEEDDISDDEQTYLLGKIAKRIDSFHMLEDDHIPFLSKLKSWF